MLNEEKRSLLTTFLDELEQQPGVTFLDGKKPWEPRAKLHHVFFVDLPLASASVHIQQGDFSRQGFTNAAGRISFDLNPAELGNLDVTVTRSGRIPVVGVARITGPAWVSGSVTAVWHQHLNSDHSLIRLHLDQSINGDAHRGWYANNSHPDYQIILDAATDAYVASKKISLFVNNIDEGGTVEKFRFGHLVLQMEDRFDPDRTADLERSELNPAMLTNAELSGDED